MRSVFTILLSGIISFSNAIAADIDSMCNEDHFSVNSRPIPHEERVAIQEERSQKECKAKKKYFENQSRRTIQKKYYSGEPAAPAIPYDPAATGEPSPNSPSNLSTVATALSGSYGLHVSSNYPPSIHKAISISMKGDLIEMEDKSFWSISYNDIHKVIDWIPATPSEGDIVVSGDPLAISQNTAWFSIFSYRIHNLNTGKYVDANLSLGPGKENSYTRHIVSVEYDHGLLRLNDGSFWSLSNDQRILKKWFVGDAVIVGVNDSWVTWGKPYILINVETDSYLTAKLK